MSAKNRKDALPPEEQLARLRRGAVDITTEEELLEKLRCSEKTGEPLRVKLGVDPTSPDIHLGHTVVLRKLREFQDLGHKAVLIIGDGTARVGDPSGQNKTRPTPTPEEIEENARTYLDQVSCVVDVESAEIVRNGEWFSKLSFEELLALAAKVTVARILERDDFERRWRANQPIYLHELLYPVMQGYDSIMVRADVELGGTDQTFNLLMGRQMQRETGCDPQVTLTLPILVGLDGTEKMSKSLGNYVGVTDAPEDMYGKIMSIPDELMESYFELLTSIPQEEYASTLKESHPRDAKAQLAAAIVSDFHDEDAAKRAAEHFDRVFRRKENPEEMTTTTTPFSTTSTASPSSEEPAGVWIVDLIRAADFASSNSEARRLISQGAVRLDGERITDSTARVKVEGGEVLQVGKKRFTRLEKK